MKKVMIVLLSIFMMMFVACDRNELGLDNEVPDTNNAGPRGIFALTDAPADELSLLQVELTELKIVDTLDQETIIFTESEDETFVLNLLNLQDLNALLASVPMEPGVYKKIYLSYKNAVALDNDGNSLTVGPQHYGTAKVILNPYITIGSDNVFVQIDFDLNNSVFNIVAGPKGSLMLMPTLVVKVGSSTDPDPEIAEFNGIVDAVGEMALVITHDDTAINIVLTDETIVDVADIITMPIMPGFDLTALLKVGDLVEVDGTLDIATNVVTATKIERKFENHGLESQGVVVGLTDVSFDLLVLEARDSGFAPGSVQTIAYDASTFFLYSDPYLAATYEQLALGQDVRVTGFPDDAATAQKVKMRGTKMLGTVASVSGTQVTVNVASLEGIDIENIPGFVNPQTVDFDGDFPTGIAVDDYVKFCGHFNYNTIGVFTAHEYEIKTEDEEDEEGDGDQGTWVGKVFSIITTSPLQISLTRGNDNDSSGARTVTVLVNADTTIIEKYKSSSETITPDTLVEGINGGLYTQLKAKGTYDAVANTLTAEYIRADLKKEKKEK